MGIVFEIAYKSVIIEIVNKEEIMLFTTTSEHEQIRKAVREFAETEIKPIAFSLDQNN